MTWHPAFDRTRLADGRRIVGRGEAMTEAEWNASADPQAMLAAVSGKVSDRTLRLFSCSCCRAIWEGQECAQCASVSPHPDGLGYYCPVCHGSGRVGGLSDPRSRRAVEVAERFADGEATEEERNAAWQVASDAGEDFDRVYDAENFNLAVMAQSCVRHNVAEILKANRNRVPAATQAALLRDIVGNPWRPVRLCDGPKRVYPANQDPAWLDVSVLRWNDGTIPKLAAAMYSGNDFSAMSILGDALEDAGCSDIDILTHARSAGPHVKGCFLVDLLLGKS